MIRASLVLIVFASAAAAQGVEPGGGLEEITITAQKRAESLQDTPLAVTALSGEVMEEFARNGVASLAFQTPSVAYSEAGGEAQLYIRGIGSNLFSVGADPSVALNLDGIYLGRTNMGLMQFLDVERVEVLRGPQGTLYGRNATGGAINILSRMPTETFEGYATLGIGSFNRRELRAAVSGPISDQWSFRVAARGLKDDGYTDDIDPAGTNNLDDNDLKAVRGILRWGGDALTATLIGDYSEFSNGNTSIRPIDDGLGLAESAGAVTPSDFHTQRNNTPSFHDWQTGGITLNVEWALSDSLDLTWISGYREWDSDFLFNTDGTEIEVTRSTFLFDTSQYSTELRLAGNQGWGKWLVGAFYFEEDKFGALGLVRANQTGPAGGPALDPTFVPRSFIIAGDNQGEAYAFFGQVDFRLGEDWTLTAGVRYSNETKTDLNTQSTLLPDTELLGLYTPHPIPPPFAVRQGKESWDAWTPKLGIEWRPSDAAMLYASYTEGFKSGGFNSLQVSNPPYDPEYVTSYEIGAKTQWLDNRLRLNAAAFYYDYDDLQVTTFLNSLTYVTNAAQATIKGIELELQARPVDEFDVGASLSWLDATYDEFMAVYGTCRPTNAALDPAHCPNPAITTPRLVDVSGNRLNNAPEWKGNAYARYTFQLPSGSLALIGEVAYQGDLYINTPTNSDFMKQTAITLLDARIAWTSASGAAEIGVYGKNLLDEEYFHNFVQFTSTSDARRDVFGIGNVLGYAAVGRNWGLDFTWRFGH